MDEKLLPKYIYYVGLFCVIFIIILNLYWYYIRPRHYTKLHQKSKNFEGFKYFRLTNQSEAEELTQPVRNTFCHMLI